MASVKSYPSLAADVDPATADVPVGGYVCRKEQVSFHEKLPVTELTVRNTGDRPIQVGSHFHFFEVNRALQFDRERAFGMRLNVPAGTAVRFEPGDEKVVTLVELAGAREVYGLNALTDGAATAPGRAASVKRATAGGFLGAGS